jgi:hypothetical protein
MPAREYDQTAVVVGLFGRTLTEVEPKLHTQLTAIYREVMWLAKRRGVSASAARAWYTHIRKGDARLTQFSGKVSRAALAPSATLRLEHYKRLQTVLTQLVQRHKKLKRPNPEEFIRVLLACERVHIVTFLENYAALMARGNYRKAGIELIRWKTLTLKQRERLWTRMLRGRVANAKAYRPTKAAS